MSFHEQLHRILTDEAANQSPFPSPKPATFRPSVAVIVGVLTTVFSLTFLLLLYAKHCKRQESSTYATTNNAFNSSTDHRNSGVARAVVDSLPVFRFGALQGQKEGLECAVCLGRFEPAELLRLLPKCKHGFHVECVDVWLEAHSTCPLCRVRVRPEDVLLLPNPKPEPEPEPSAVRIPRRVSGRHSSAGERSSTLQVVVQSGKGRKDGLLMAENTAEREEFERRYSHRIVVGGGGGGEGKRRDGGERWSDLRPSDLLFLRSDMLKNVNSLRSVSEITGVARAGAVPVDNGASS